MLSFTRWFRRSVPAAKARRPAKFPPYRFRPFVEQLEGRFLLSSTYLVTSLADTNTLGTLRFEILLANMNNTGTAASPDQIQFTTGGGTINVAGSPLPALTDIAVLDATTATGYGGTPVITLDGVLAGVGADGLTISGGSSTVKGLDIIHFSGNGIRLDTNGSDIILSSYIGITTAGAVAANGANGIFINGTAGNTVGSTTAVGSPTGLGANVISGNGLDGIMIDGLSATGNVILNNFIGTNATGTAALGNAGNGIQITVGASQNTIGGNTPPAMGATGKPPDGNVISGNGANGVLLTGAAGSNTVSDNFIGTDVAGTTALGNALDGVKVENAAHNVIGNSNPVTGITYYNAESAGTLPVSGWQGIRGADTSGQYLITGTSNADGLLFQGTIAGVGTSSAVDYPNAFNTSVYGPDNLGSGNIRLVGVYKNPDFATAPVEVNGFVFQGTTADLTNANNYSTIDYPGATFNYVHSTMNGLVVGNYDSPVQHGSFGLPFGPGHAFLYDIAQNRFLSDIVFPGAISNTAYGIWYNGGTSYTICGGYSLDPLNNFDDQSRPIGQGYLVDYDSATGQFTHWTSFSYPFGTNFVTHFEGISSVEKGVYTLSADSAQAGTSNPVQGSWVTVRRNTDGSFDQGVWVNLNYTGPGLNPGTTYVTSSNSVFGNQVVGIVFGGPSLISFQATVNTGFQLSNVISGNGGDGIGLDGANDNQVARNYIGTDLTGMLDLGNAANGIHVTNGAARNLIGGEATGGNDPTNSVFVRPPEGNLISGNDADGVLIDINATQNQLSGNFIGTDFSGNAALGNSMDGVAILQADNNSLLGCTFQQDPFVFYNVIGGNGGNGLRIHDSNNTTVQANFFGLGANNSTPVGNALNGVLIDGTSRNTQFGGVIPLGNVVAGNGRNGVEIADTASGTVCFNTFCGLPAFIATAVGNALDGFLIISTGGNNLLRTNVISGNLGNGVHITGNATGVQVAEDIIGMTTNGQAALPNGANGVLIDGNAQGNIIGGLQASVILQNTISANGANGIAIVGNAADNQVFHSDVGTDITGVTAFGNAGAGVLIGGNALDNTIGGTSAFDQNVISGNLGGGIQLSGSSQGTQVIGNLIGTNRDGQRALANQGNGISITSSNNQVGGTAAGDGNIIAFNTQDGVAVDTGTGNGILANSIFSNGAGGILLVNTGNHNQPAPVLTGAFQLTPTSVQINGTLTAAASTTYTVEFFASPSSTPGQGQNFLGSLTVTTDANGVASFTFNSTLAASAGTTFTATATDPANNTSAFSAPLSAMSTPAFAVGAGAGGGPQVNVYSASGTLLASFFAYDPSFTGGVTVAVGDVNGDGVPDIITGAGPGGGPNVKVIDGTKLNQVQANGEITTSALLASFFAYDPSFTGGVFVAAGRFDSGPGLDVVTGAGPGGGPHVEVFQVQGGVASVLAGPLGSFFAYDQGFRGGVTVAAGDVEGIGHDDLITGAGPGGGPHVEVWRPDGTLDASFMAYDSSFAGGVFVAAGTLSSGGPVDVITGAGAGGGPNVRVFGGPGLALQASFFAFDPSFGGGVRVGVASVNGSGAVVLGAGPGGGPEVQVFDAVTMTDLERFFAFAPQFQGGVFVG